MMKTSKTNLKGICATILAVGLVLVLSSCGSQAEKSGENGDQVLKAEVKTPGMDIHTATILGDLDVIKQHIAAGSDLNEQEPTMGSSPLISAAVFDKREIVRALIEAGADVNLQNSEGSTALHSAAFLCRMEIVELLLTSGADRSLKNIYGSTPLESLLPSFDDVKFIYDQFSRDLGPLGFKLDYAYVASTRPKIAELLQN